MKYDVTAITPTRDRPEAFDLCKKWMARQSGHGYVQWIIVDDGDIPASYVDNPQTTIEVLQLRRNPSQDRCTLQDNLLHAIPHIQGGKVLIWEDDEWYAPGYIYEISRMLDTAWLVGEKNAHYYNVASRRWYTPDNQKHASLCRTGFVVPLIKELEKACIESKAEGDVFVDLRLWGLKSGAPAHPSTMLKDWSGLSVGIKGMPGRGGLGKSHGLTTFKNKDPQMAVLREWIGADAQEYEKYYQVNK